MVLTHARKTTGIERCIQNCENGHEACLELIEHFLRQGWSWAAPERIKLLEDCSEICRTTADFMIRDSRRHPVICRACATICDEVSRDLEAFADDDLVRQCAEICRHCAQSCEALAGAPAQA